MNNFCFRQVENPFSDAKKKEIAEEIMEFLEKIETLDEKKKVAVNAFKVERENLLAESQRLRRLYKDGFDVEEVECSVERDFSTNSKTIRRKDNGELIEEIAIPAEERQVMIDIPPEGVKDVESVSSKVDQLFPAGQEIDNESEEVAVDEENASNDGDKIVDTWPTNDQFGVDYLELTQSKQAEKYGVSVDTLKNRIRKMRKEGVIGHKSQVVESLDFDSVETTT